ncbi:MFS transporter, partial [Acidimicrobiaceae bacterium USS-CC1]|nr:MFS transporter [Acidiferrimicrobium australe]
MGDGRLGVAEPLRRPPERAGVGHRHQGPQLPQADPPVEGPGGDVLVVGGGSNGNDRSSRSLWPDPFHKHRIRVPVCFILQGLNEENLHVRTDLAREDGPAATRPGSGPRSRRPAGGVSALVYALIFVTAVSQATIVPLLPTVAHRYGLRASELAWVLTLPSLAMLVTSTPIGLLGDRLGNRRVTLAGGGLLAVAALAQGVPSLPVLVLGRLLFGVGYGALWTTGLAWLAGLDPGTSARRLGGTVTASAVGATVGPTLAGVLASRYGFAVPFLVAGAVTAVVAAALVGLRGGG